jgi:hypothetical protein
MPRWTTDSLAVLALWASSAAPLAAQATDERPGPQYCANCHINVPDKTKYWVGEQWAGWDADPHRRANEVLDNRLGKRMAELLAKHSTDSASWKEGVRKDVRCTVCHGGITKVDGSPAVGPDTQPTAGLDCFDCHQQPGGNDKWMTVHAFLQQPTDKTKPTHPISTRWRSLTPEEKRNLGFRPLHDPKERATTCLSCHVGNAAEGKFVTHEMYAAGHPPLASVELAKFSEETSYTEAHWLSPKDSRKKAHGFDDNVALFRAQLAVQSAVAALRTQAELAKAAAQSDFKHKHIAWGDYAFFDCAACHHDLTNDSWRQKRAKAGPQATGAKVFGRPPLVEWPSAFAMALQGDSLRQRLDDLRYAATETPFGNPTKVAAAAETLVAALEKVAPKLDSPDDWRKVLRQVLELGAKTDLDFDSARQLAWLAESLASSLDGNDPLAKAVTDSFKKLAFNTEPRYLPKWSIAKGGIPDLGAPDRLQGLADILKAKRVYDPAAFQQWCGDVLKASNPPTP